MRLTEYVKQQPSRTQQAWADDFGISRAFFYQLISGNRNPSLAVMVRIESETGGAVPLSSWADNAVMPEPRKTGEYVEP